MTNAIFEVDAELRDAIGKGASRRLRRQQNKVTAIMYGGDEKPTPISLDHNKILQSIQHEAFYSHILTLNISGKRQQAVLKDVQRHPFKKIIMHMDFQRIKETDIINMKVPLHFIGTDVCRGVKKGGIINHQAMDVEIRCQANKLPEFIEIDLSDLDLDHAIHLSDLKLPSGVTIPVLAHEKEHDLPIVSIHIPRAKVEEETKAETPTEEQPATVATEEKSANKEKQKS